MQIARHIKAESTGIGNDLRAFDKQVLPAEKQFILTTCV